MYTYRLVKLGMEHIEVSFDTGNSSVDEFWQKRYDYAEEGYSMIYVAETNDGDPRGYFTLSTGSLYCTIDGQEKRWPMILLGQIGVDQKYHGQGVGEFLIKQAIQISYKFFLNDKIACRGLYLDVDPNAEYLIETWYPKYGFVKLDTNRRLVSMFIDFHQFEPM